MLKQVFGAGGAGLVLKNRPVQRRFGTHYPLARKGSALLVGCLHVENGSARSLAIFVDDAEYIGVLGLLNEEVGRESLLLSQRS